MDTDGTIVAVASPPGRAARGIVRASGREACAAAAAVLAGDCPAREAIAARRRGVHAARLRDPAIPVLVLVMPGPESATGEDCTEIHAPGNPALLERIVAAAVAGAGGNARRAAPGEFSARAVLAGRTDIAGAERVAAAIAAETDAGLAAAERLRSGAAHAAVAADAEEVAAVLALVEAGIDFTDQEDVVAIARPELERRIAAVRDSLRARASRARAQEAASHAPRVVLVGAPNAGKSSLFNALVGAERTVAADGRGTTRDAVEHALRLPGGEAVLVDLPGIEEAEGELDVLAQRRAGDEIDRADLLLECSEDGSAADAALPAGVPSIRVRTKADARRDGPREAVATSAVTGAGIEALRSRIAAALASAAPRAAGDAALGAARRALVAEAAGSLDSALREHAPELVAACLRTALDRLGEVSGAIPPDDVLGRLFAGFCVGK
jgi:tRNA modification GTPase